MQQGWFFGYAQADGSRLQSVAILISEGCDLMKSGINSCSE